MRPFVYGAVIGVVLSGGCTTSAGVGPDKSETPLAHGAISVVRLSPGPDPLASYSGLSGETRVVIRESEKWSEIWAAIWSIQSAIPPLPAIDFTREMVIVVGMGTRPSGGHSIRVESATQRPGEIEVILRAESPGPSCMTTGALTQSVDAARIPRSAEPVRFTVRESVVGC